MPKKITALVVNREEYQLVMALIDRNGAVTTSEFGRAAKHCRLTMAANIFPYATRILSRMKEQGQITKVPGGKMGDIWIRPGQSISPATMLRYGLGPGDEVRRRGIHRLRRFLGMAMKDLIEISSWLEAEDKLGPQRKNCKADPLIDESVEMLHEACRSVAHAYGITDVVLGAPNMPLGKLKDLLKEEIDE